MRQLGCEHLFSANSSACGCGAVRRRMVMGRTAIMLAATTAFMLGGMLTSQAQMERGPAALADTAKNFTPIEKAACGPHYGKYCGPFHHRVCDRWRCWCAPC